MHVWPCNCYWSTGLSSESLASLALFVHEVVSDHSSIGDGSCKLEQRDHQSSIASQTPRQYEGSQVIRRGTQVEFQGGGSHSRQAPISTSASDRGVDSPP